VNSLTDFWVVNIKKVIALTAFFVASYSAWADEDYKGEDVYKAERADST